MNRTRNYECMCLLDNTEVRKGWEPLKEAAAGLRAEASRTEGGAVTMARRAWVTVGLVLALALSVLSPTPALAVKDGACHQSCIPAWRGHLFRLRQRT